MYEAAMYDVPQPATQPNQLSTLALEDSELPPGLQWWDLIWKRGKASRASCISAIQVGVSEEAVNIE